MRVNYPQGMTQQEFERLYDGNAKSFLFMRSVIENTKKDLNDRIAGVMKLLYIYAGVYYGGAFILPFFLENDALQLWPIIGVGFLYGHLIVGLPALQNYNYQATSKMMYILMVNQHIAEQKKHENTTSEHQKV